LADSFRWRPVLAVNQAAAPIETMDRVLQHLPPPIYAAFSGNPEVGLHTTVSCITKSDRDFDREKPDLTPVDRVFCPEHGFIQCGRQ
jgi:hypothetical protein